MLLGHTRNMALSFRRDYPDLVLGRLEADPGRRDVVDHDRVQPLERELLAAVGDRAVAVLGREADQPLAGPPAPGERGQDVLRTGQLEGQGLARGVLLELAGVLGG